METDCCVHVAENKVSEIFSKVSGRYYTTVITPPSIKKPPELKVAQHFWLCYEVLYPQQRKNYPHTQSKQWSTRITFVCRFNNPRYSMESKRKILNRANQVLQYP